MWMGGWAPLGYRGPGSQTIVNEADAKLVRSIFQRFLKARLGHHVGKRVDCGKHSQQIQQAD